MSRYLRVGLLLLSVGVSSSSCFRSIVVGACNPLQTVAGEPIDATCWVRSPLNPMELAIPGTFTQIPNSSNDSDLPELIKAWSLTASQKQSFESDVSKVDVSCVAEGSSSLCRWQVDSRPKNPSVRAVFGKMVTEVIETIQGQYPEATTARIAFWEKDHEKGPRLLVVLQNWKIEHMVWTDDRVMVQNRSR
jgi:hypothetical protein